MSPPEMQGGKYKNSAHSADYSDIKCGIRRGMGQHPITDRRNEHDKRQDTHR